MAEHMSEKKWTTPDFLLLGWIILAAITSVTVSVVLKASFPLFPLAWLIAPLIDLLITGKASRSGFRRITWRSFAAAGLLNLFFTGVVMLLVEPWSHTYQSLVRLAAGSPTPDSTFVWLVRFQDSRMWIGMLLYSGLVTLFAEELFFRGWLLQRMLHRFPAFLAVAIQAAIFVVPNLLVAAILPGAQGWLYAIVYTWLAIGVIGGLAAQSTQSIFPSLISAALINLVLVIFVW